MFILDDSAPAKAEPRRSSFCIDKQGIRHYSMTFLFDQSARTGHIYSEDNFDVDKPPLFVFSQAPKEYSINSINLNLDLRYMCGAVERMTVMAEDGVASHLIIDWRLLASPTAQDAAAEISEMGLTIAPMGMGTLEPVFDGKYYHVRDYSLMGFSLVGK